MKQNTILITVTLIMLILAGVHLAESQIERNAREMEQFREWMADPALREIILERVRNGN